MVTRVGKTICPYCGFVLAKDVEDSLEHLRVHRVLRHKVLPGMYRNNIGQPSAVNRIQNIFRLLQ